LDDFCELEPTVETVGYYRALLRSFHHAFPCHAEAPAEADSTISISAGERQDLEKAESSGGKTETGKAES
jgi:hypothetical protein